MKNEKEEMQMAGWGNCGQCDGHNKKQKLERAIENGSVYSRGREIRTILLEVEIQEVVPIRGLIAKR